MTKEKATELLTIYGRAWEERDPNLIVTIFTPDASYNDPKEAENFGHDGIRAYWISKVVGEQKDIKFKLLNVWVDADIVVAEWEAEFIDTKRNFHIHIEEVGIFTVSGDKFGSLREYYKTVKTPLS